MPCPMPASFASRAPSLAQNSHPPLASSSSCSRFLWSASAAVNDSPPAGAARRSSSSRVPLSSWAGCCKISNGTSAT
eukprot:326638-Prymnesium_polylepis.1